MVKSLTNRNVILSVVMALVVSLSLTSCDTLKKKFTRKKKGSIETQEFEPVLEAQDYPSPDHNPIEIYKQHYAVIKSWYKELWYGIDEKKNDKQVKYSLKQIYDRIDQMKALFIPEKAKRFDQLVSLLSYYKDSLNQMREMRNYSRIQSDLRAFDRMLRDQFGVDQVKEDFIAQ